MGKKIDLTGQVFGRLVVICEDGQDKHHSVLWLCKCSCGNEVTVNGDYLRNGHTTSCGCYMKECLSKRMSEFKTKHGMSGTRLYQTWRSILRRTGFYKGADERHKRDYIDRGITVCEEWKSFENFKSWAISSGYSDDLQIDRCDNNSGYCPENCRWVSRKENMNNRRCTLRLEDGSSFALLCSKVGIKTNENGRITKQYRRISERYRTSHKAHPELLAKANEYLTLLRRLKASLDLLKDVREFRVQMQRLQDILDKDLKFIFETAGDFTRQTKLKVGADEVTVFASLQSSDMEFSASEKPVNAYKLELFVRTKDIPKSMSKRISRDAIIYVDGTAYKVIDSSDCRGVLGLSLSRGSARGAGMSGREL